MYATTLIGIMFTIYLLLVLSIMGLFAYTVTYHKRIHFGFEFSIGAWIVFLTILAILFHVITYLKLPWIKWEILATEIEPKREISINVADYKFHLPEEPIVLRADEPVKFRVLSEDVTYGFGVFRKDGTMVFQMQVLPGYINEILWIFKDRGRYTIRSTEYSGPENFKMVMEEAIVVE